MIIILEAARTPRRRTAEPETAIREVCLVGDPDRRYRHAAPGGPGAEDSGPRGYLRRLSEAGPARSLGTG